MTPRNPIDALNRAMFPLSHGSKTRERARIVFLRLLAQGFIVHDVDAAGTSQPITREVTTEAGAPHPIEQAFSCEGRVP